MTRAPDIPSDRQVSLVALSLIAIFSGALTGGAAVLFRAVVALIHNVFLLGDVSFYYDPNRHTPYSWLGPLVILAPIVGGLIVVFLGRALPRDRRGQGVSDIIDAVYYREGQVRVFSAFQKSFAAGVQSGSGGSVGREAATVQIGAALCSSVAGLLRLAPWQRMTLVAAGSSAGLAAAFNAPLGSIMFALELMMPEISPRTLLPVTLATGASTFLARFFYGLQPTFLVQTAVGQQLRISGVVSLGPFIVFGILLGLVSWFLIWVLGWLEKQFAKVSHSPYIRHAIGMLWVGVIAFVMMWFTGHYFVAGPSYAAIQDMLHGQIIGIGFFAMLFLAKLCATSITLGSGGNGGMFSASLMMGAALGGALGSASAALFPALGLNVTDFVIVGMAGLLGGTTGAGIMAIVMVFELTRDYNVIVPMILCVALAIAVRRALQAESIYTLKLAKKGHEVPNALQANTWRIRHADKAMSVDFALRPAGTLLAEAIAELPETGRPLHVLVAAEEGQRLRGYVRLDPGFKLWGARSPDVSLGDMARTDFLLARADDTMFDVMGRLARRGGRLVLVVGGKHRVPRAEDVLGVISLDRMGEGVVENARAYASRDSRNPFPTLYRKRVVRPVRFWRRPRKLEPDGA